jgi:predicted transcriptional regulator
VSQVLVTIHFRKKHHFLEWLSHNTKYLQSFLRKCDYNEDKSRINIKVLLVLLCVQVVQTNKNKSSWRGKKNKQKICELTKNKFEINFKNLINKIHKLIVKELKLNVNHQVKKKEKITTFFKSNNA